MSHPKIKGITWLDEELPDLVAIDITLVSKKYEEMGIESPETPSKMYADLSKLAGVSEWYPKDSEVPSQKECFLDFEGLERFVANISVKNALAAWMYFKNCKK